MELKCLAPTMLHRAASLLILEATRLGIVETLRKALESRLFQISHEVSMMRDVKYVFQVQLV
jgi:hypothetical protein